MVPPPAAPDSLPNNTLTAAAFLHGGMQAVNPKQDLVVARPQACNMLGGRTQARCRLQKSVRRYEQAVWDCMPGCNHW